MARKSSNWDDAPAAMQSPFASLAALKKETSVGKDDGAARQPVTAPKDAALPKVKSARLDRKQRGGKTVTVVVFEGVPDDEAKAAWLKRAREKLGVGGTIEDGCAILQGDQRERVCSISGK